MKSEKDQDKNYLVYFNQMCEILSKVQSLAKEYMKFQSSPNHYEFFGFSSFISLIFEN